MSTEEPPGPNGGPRRDARPPRTLALQGLVNRLVRGLLRAPGVSRGIGRRLVTLHVVGRRSGRRFEVPVAYTRHEGDLLVGTPFAWGRNLRSGEPVQLRFKGELRTADVRVITDESGVVEHYALLAADNHNFARFNGIDLGPDGRPVPEDLHRAWTEGARVLRLTLR